MKKNLIIVSMLCFLLLLSSCGKKSSSDIVKDLTKKIDNADAYYLEGDMELINNEDIYSYDVTVSYKKEDMFKVSLINKENKHEQIILKNKDGVFVVTPALNKSFKFESNWPYNNSQVYLLQSILNDIKNDKELKFNEKNNKYIIESTVVYPNNSNLKSQTVTFSKDLIIENIAVKDESGIELIKMKFTKVDMKAVIDDKTFLFDVVEETIKQEENLIKPSSNIESIIYPMYMPGQTSLVSEDMVTKEDGERAILTFDGEKPFMIIQETASIPTSHEIIPVIGEPVMLKDTIGVMSDTSINFVNDGMEYYIVSEKLNNDELLSVAKSLTVSALEK